MFRYVLTSVTLLAAAPALAGDQAIYPHTHTNTKTVGSFTTPINYRPNGHGVDLTKVRRHGKFNHAEVVRHAGFNETDTKIFPREKHGAGSEVAPVVEIFVENFPALRGTQGTNGLALGSNLPHN
ncbi:MAG: hypothetical protein ABJN34_02385 [Litoreibacter sp.]|uniref:hypothetical protein n=1 Tax=Litoreibacter sp. TaxID=1969459 RepID=UPI00329839E7